VVEMINFEDKLELIKSKGGRGELAVLKLRGNTLLTPLAWTRLIRLPTININSSYGRMTIASVRKTPSMEMFSIVKWGDLPLWRITSFIACIIGSWELVKSSVCRFPSFPLVNMPLVVLQSDDVD
jgi:hypothetical protein